MKIPDPLLVSSPNGGGLALLDREMCLPLIEADVTGIALGRDVAVWCLQADGSRSLRELRDGQVRTISLSEAPLDLHDVMVVGDDRYVVCTQSNEVLRYDERYRLQERWSLGGEPDSSHINCIAIHQGRLVASVFGRFTEHRGYKGKSRDAGQIVDLRSGEALLEGLSQPHSLVSAGELLYLCSSEDKELVICEGFKPIRRVALPGYTRGLAVGANHVYVGLSRSRNLEVESDTGYFDTGSIAILRRDDLEFLGAVPVPWKEIYDIRIVQDSPLLNDLIAVSWGEERARAAVQFAELQQAKDNELVSARTAAQEERTHAAAKLAELQQAKAAELASARTAAQEERTRATARFTELQQAKAAELASARTAAQEERTRTAARLAELQQAKDAELASAQQSLAAAMQEALALNGQLEVLSERVARRDGQVVRLRASHAQLAQFAIQRQQELETLGERILELQQTLADANAAHDQRIEDANAAHHQRIAELSATAQAREARISELVTTIERLNDRVKSLAGVVAQRDERVHELVGMVERLRDRAKSVAELVALRDGRIGELETALKQANARARDLAIQVSRLEPMAEELAVVKQSRSWRLTRPLRFVMRLVRNRGLVGSDRDRVLSRLGLTSRLAAGSIAHSALPGVVPQLPVPIAAPVGSRPPADHAQAATAATARPAPVPAAKPAGRPVRKKAAEVTLAPQLQGLDDVFVWAVIDWHFRTQRPQHLARELAHTGRRVFYVSNNLIDSPEPGFRVEPLDDSGRLFQVFLHVAGKPVIYFDPPSAEAQRQLAASLAVLLQWTRSLRTLSLVQHPFWSQAAQSLPNHRLVYDCMDHHGGFENNGSRILELENELMRSADLLVVSSEWLNEEGAKLNGNRALIRNAGEYTHFCERPAEVFRDPSGRRVIGYYGAIAAWFDVALVEAVARDNPDCLVLLIGGDTCKARDRLRHCSNVEFTGEVPYAKLPYYLYGFDVCLLPFLVLPLTLATNPVKAYEYLSAGIPVISVDLPEMHQFGELVRRSADQGAFLHGVKQALREPKDDPLRQRRRVFAAGQTWAHRAQELVDAVAVIPEPSVSVVVLTYNNLELTRACLESLERFSDYPALEIIVVDNASSDGTPAYLREWAGDARNRRLILNEDNRGFAAGNNQGLEVASGEYLVLLNNDTQVTPGWVRTLLGHLRRDPSIGIIGPVTNNIGNEARIETDYTDMDGMLAAAASYTLRHPGQALAMRTVAFFCVMLPRAVYERIGGLDEAFGIGFFEDDDYCRRIEKQGLRVVCAEDVFVHHHLSASFNKLHADRKKELFDRNKAIYEAKWGEWVPHRYRDKASA